LAALYRDATVFAMPSVYEPFGVAFLEAMAYRLPCLGSDRCAMPEIVEEGITGYTVDAFDTETLARRLLELAEGDRARAFGEAGHRRFLERFTWDGVAAKMVDAVAARLS
jgi:glycosyltransferase involved in cell wall biosynthesis